MASSMPTFTITLPDGSTQTGPNFSISANANDASLLYQLVTGMAQGWALSVVSGTAEQPQYMVWTSGTYRVRATLTWVSGNITAITWEVSQDSGTTPNASGTWASMGTAQAFNYDGSGNLTTTTNAGGFMSWLLYLLGKVKALLTSFNSHTGTSISTAHSGAGTMATQNASAIAATGGTIDGTAIGGTTPAQGQFTKVTEGINTLQTPGSGAGVALDWTKGNSRVTNSGTNAITFSNITAAGLASHMVYVSAFNSCTWPASLPNGNWGSAGKPSIATAAWVSLFTPDGGTTVYGSIAWK